MPVRTTTAQPGGRGLNGWLSDQQQQAKDAPRGAEARWRGLIPAEYGEQVHRVAARFAIHEAALLLGRIITGWDEQTCRDAIQHSYSRMGERVWHRQQRASVDCYADGSVSECQWL